MPLPSDRVNSAMAANTTVKFVHLFQSALAEELKDPNGPYANAFKALGWQVHAKAKRGKGTLFTFDVPFGLDRRDGYRGRSAAFTTQFRSILPQAMRDFVSKHKILDVYQSYEDAILYEATRDQMSNFKDLDSK